MSLDESEEEQEYLSCEVCHMLIHSSDDGCEYGWDGDRIRYQCPNMLCYRCDSNDVEYCSEYCKNVVRVLERLDSDVLQGVAPGTHK